MTPLSFLPSAYASIFHRYARFHPSLVAMLCDKCLLTILGFHPPSLIYSGNPCWCDSKNQGSLTPFRVRQFSMSNLGRNRRVENRLSVDDGCSTKSSRMRENLDIITHTKKGAFAYNSQRKMRFPTLLFIQQ